MCEYVCISVRGRRTQRHSQMPRPGVTPCILSCHTEGTRPAGPTMLQDGTDPPLGAGGRKRPQVAQPRPSPACSPGGPGSHGHLPDARWSPAAGVGAGGWNWGGPRGPPASGTRQDPATDIPRYWELTSLDLIPPYRARG